MRSAWSDRIGGLLSLGLLAALGLSSWVFSSLTQIPDWIKASQQQTGPTAVVANAHIVKTGADGRPRQVVVSPQIQQFEDGRAMLATPDLTSFRDQGPPVYAKSRQARVSADQNEVLLTGSVVIRREAFGDDPALRVETETLTFLSDEQVAVTQAPVMVYRGASTLYGVGMRLDEKTDRLQILADTRMVLPKSKPEEKKP
jgi:lipopolysaccharide export system protein LptC